MPDPYARKAANSDEQTRDARLNNSASASACGRRRTPFLEDFGRLLMIRLLLILAGSTSQLASRLAAPTTGGCSGSRRTARRAEWQGCEVRRGQVPADSSTSRCHPGG